MAFGRTTVYWDIRDFDNDIGSVRVSRCNDDGGEMGSYSVVATLDSGSPNFVGSYVGSNAFDTLTSWYKVQVLDSGTGSSWSGSSIATRPIESRLTNIKAIKDVARLTANTDISDFEILRFIDDAEATIYENYGNPIRRTNFYLDDSIGSTVYDFTGNRVPVYTVHELRVDGEAVSRSSGSWELGLNQGFIKFNSTYQTLKNNKNVSIDWIPKAFHTLATYRAALDIIDSSQIIDGEEVRNPLAIKLERRMGSIEKSIMPKGVFRSTPYEFWRETDEVWVNQWEHNDS